MKNWSVFCALFVFTFFAHAAQRTNTNAHPEKKWEFPTGGAVTASPALSADGLTLYVGSADRNFYAIDAETGDEKWSVRLPAPITASAMIDDDGTIYVPCANGALYAIIDDEFEGTFKWTKSIDGIVRPNPFRALRKGISSPVIADDGTIYVGAQDNRLYALDPADGGILDGWPLIAPNDVGTPMIATADGAQEDSMYFVSGGKLYGVSLDGAQQSLFAPGTSIRSIPAVGEEGSIFFGADDERVYALYSGGTSNDLRWRFNTGENVSSSPVIGASGDIYIGSESARLYCLTTNGVLRWSVSTRRPVRSALSIGADGTVYAGSDDRNMYAVSADGHIRWTFPTGGRVRSAAAIDAEGTLYFGSTDKKVYAVYDDAAADDGENVWPMFRRDRYHSAKAMGGAPFIIQEPLGTNVPRSFIESNIVNGISRFVVTNGFSTLTVTNGDNVLVSVVARAGVPITYQWRLNGEDISSVSNRSVTNATLVLTNIQPSAAGVYTVQMETDLGLAHSDDFKLIVQSTPVLTGTRSNQFLLTGSTLTLNAGAVGTQPLFYQWKTNGVAIPGATNATFTITNAQPGDSSSYSVMVMNSIGAVSSTPITVTIFPVTLTLAEHPLGAGARHSLAVLPDRTLWTWGLNNFGQLGNNLNSSVVTNSTPLLIGTNGTASTNAVWASISGGGRGADVSTNQPGGFSLGIQTNGTLWSWGANHSGQLGIGSTTLQRTPTQVGSDSNWFQVEAGASHTLAIKRDGSLWSWGANSVGQLGLGTSNASTAPMRVGTDSAWVEVRAGGLFSLARRADGTIWSWGANTNGQLGLGSNTTTRVPTQIGTDADWAALSAGVAHTLALKTNGTLWGWGQNSSGQLGNGTSVATNRPTQSGTGGGWSLIEAGSFHSLAIRTNGALFAWGQNNFGQLGNGQIGNDASQFSPVPIAPSETWRAIDASTHSLGMTTDGRVFAWGWNINGQVGDGSTNTRTAPVQLSFILNTNASTNVVSTGPPAITTQPTNRTVAEGGAAAFSITVTGAPSLFVQWFFNSNAIASSANATATNTSLLLANIQSANSGFYHAVVTNNLGSAMSSVASLTVTNGGGGIFPPGGTNTNSAPAITQQPASQSALTNSPASFAVVASGTPTLFYQWRFNLTNLIAGATNSTLTFTSVRAADAGFYDVRITNNIGATSSVLAQLIVTNSDGSMAGSFALGAMSLSGAGATLPFVGAGDGRTFVLEFRDALEGATWTPITTNSGTGFVDPAMPTNASRFYRLRVQ